jgi:Zn-dependent protease with chaperone function
MIEFCGDYLDGLRSRARPTTLVLPGDGTLRLAGIEPPREYALRDVRIAPRVGTTLRALTFPNGARCETHDRMAIDELERQKGMTLAARLLRTLEARWWSALSAGLLLVVVIAGATLALLPLGTQRLVMNIPSSVARELGDGALPAFDRSLLAPSKLRPSRKLELQRAFAKVARNYPGAPLELDFRRGIGPNAFALPDGTVIVTDELIALAENDSEIVAALMHEIGHVHHRHGLRLALESSTVLFLVATYLGDLTHATSLSTGIPALYLHARYSREHEREADAFAIEHLKAARIDAHHFANLLDKLDASSTPELEYELPYLKSHPPTRERTARLREASAANAAAQPR